MKPEAIAGVAPASAADIVNAKHLVNRVMALSGDISRLV
jgi:hypothetical protein